jgi:molecular chaperone GrpE (heat shock protein)
MTKEDIKKALKICTDLLSPCNGCPYEIDADCDNTLHADVLTLITEQEKEIEQFKGSYARLQKLFAQYQMASDKEIKAQRKQAKIAVLNELKVRHDYANMTMGYPWDISQEIDELIKQVENE